MSKQKSDSFHAYLVESAKFDGKWEIPSIESAVDAVPLKSAQFGGGMMGGGTSGLFYGTKGS